MSEDGLKKRLKWITEEIFKGSQVAVANAAGCGESHISQILNPNLPKKRPSNSLLETLVKNLPAGNDDITVQWILFGGQRGIRPADTTDPAVRTTPNCILRETPDDGGGPQASMHSEETKELRSAILWLLRDFTDDQLDKLDAQARRDGSLSRAAKNAIRTASEEQSDRMKKKTMQHN